MVMRILSLEDDRAFLELIRAALEAEGIDHELVHVTSRQEFEQALRDEGPFDLILADYSVPQFDGISALRIVRQKRLEMPFILVSGSLGEELAIDSLKEGATDYVLKQRLSRLIPAIRRAMRETEERKERLRAELRMQEQSRLLDLASDAILQQDLEDTILYWNRGAERLYGWSSAEAVGKKTSQLIYRNADSLAEPRQQLALTGEWSGDLKQLTRAGKEVITSNRWTLVHDEAGMARSILSIATDVTERRSLEAQLRQSQKMEAVGQLAGGVAHDFNNLLTVIQGHSSLLLAGGTLSKSASESVQMVMESAERAAGLTRQLLMVSRKQTPQMGQVDLNKAVAGMVRMLQRTLGEHIHLDVQPGLNLPRIHADPGMIDQVLLNLAVNARDAMPNGGKLTIRTSISPPAQPGLGSPMPSSSVTLQCTDTGMGIPPEVLPRIFEPFFTTKEAGKGTGLGLATVHGIVQQHRGSIEVSSEVGNGTTFLIALPAATETPAAAASKGEASGTQGGTETILVVEDEPVVRQLMQNILGRFGYQVLEAASGLAALKIWRQQPHRIALLLTDVVMPDGMTGWDLAEQLSKDQPKLKIVYTTGYGAELIGKERHLKEGVNFVQKPFTPAKLLQTVRRCLDAQDA
jgi:two-component system cell cycle sensor histidine kinase/response regulator CckA